MRRETDPDVDLRPMLSSRRPSWNGTMHGATTTTEWRAKVGAKRENLTKMARDAFSYPYICKSCLACMRPGPPSQRR
jgi:hypothetical protein